LGEEFVDGEQMNRKRLAAFAFRDARFRRRLNALTHPEVTRRMFARLDPLGARLVFVEVPLLIEASLQGRFERVWVVDAGPAERLRRLTAKLGGDEAAAKARLASQLPTEAKKAFADRIVRTNSGLESVKILAANLVAMVS
jgi:dephospho-CoA kinase